MDPFCFMLMESKPKPQFTLQHISTYKETYLPFRGGDQRLSGSAGDVERGDGADQIRHNCTTSYMLHTIKRETPWKPNAITENRKGVIACRRFLFAYHVGGRPG